jgi:DNA-binding NarL/FixJ family response regulator
MVAQRSFEAAKNRSGSSSVLVLLSNVQRDELDSVIDNVRQSYPRGEVFLVHGDKPDLHGARVVPSGNEGDPVSTVHGGGVSDLTSRETEVLSLIARGATNKEIAVTLSISHNTVRAHARSVMQKLRVANRIQAAAVATHAGLTSLGGIYGDPNSR